MDRKDLQPVILNATGAEGCEEPMSSDKARRMLGWAPRHSFEEGLHKTVRWYRQFEADAQPERRAATG